MKQTFLLILVSVLFISCTNTNKSPISKSDPHSFSNPNDVVITHMNLDLDIDFKNKQINGIAELTIKNSTQSELLILDTYDLTINKVLLGKDEIETEFELGKKDTVLGSPLKIKISPQTQLVKIYYATGDDATALQWLNAEQTEDKNHPFLFTQSQEINARSWIPCQDSPGVRFTYTAKVTVPKDLLALMSARNPKEKNASGIYVFEMPQPIPSYLLAIAVGDVQFSELGPRTGVYAEPSVLPRAATEFIDTEKMIRASEELYGPYLWERYDMIVLPPSFPYGGMENPRLTFLTPTLLAGDKSLTNVVAHEIAHSWSGNLVTNATWNDFWLNEGFTSYFEQRIMEKVYGFEYKEMLAHLDYQNLLHVLEKMGKENPDTRLYLDMSGRDPDKKVSAIAYDKGALFLRTIEETIGREKFDKFLSEYFERYKFRTMTSDNFVEYLSENLIDGDSDLADSLQIEQWVYEPGLPNNHVVPHSEQFDLVDEQVKIWLAGIPANEIDNELWTTHHYLHFIREIPWTMAKSQLRDLDSAFNFTDTNNSEILHAWLLRAIHNNYKPAYAKLENFLMSMGRRKFLRPLYSKLAETEEGKELALNIYEKARPLYHPISRHTIDEILNWNIK